MNIARLEGLTLPQSEMSAEEQEERHHAEIKRASVAAMLNDASRFYHSQLTPEARDYFLDRGVSETTIDDLLLGWAGKDKRALLTHLYERCKDKDLLLETGLFYEDDGKLYDAFKERYIFPYFRTKEDVCYFIARDATGKTYTDFETGTVKKRSKYKKLRKTESPAVQHVLWNAYKVGKEKPILVVEGIVDALLAQQALPEYDVISPVTTRINKTDIARLSEMLVKRGRCVVIFCNDAEANAAGAAGALQTAERLTEAVTKSLTEVASENGLQGDELKTWIAQRLPEIRIATLQKPPEIEKIDVADYIQSGKVDELRYWIQAARDIPRYRLYLDEDPQRFFDGKTFAVKELTDEMRFEGRYYLDVAETLHGYEKGVYKPAEPLVKKLASDKLIRKRNADRIEAAIKDLRVQRYVDIDTVNAPGYLNCANGILDLEKLQIVSHSPDTFSTVQVPVAYNHQADCPRFEAFLKQIVPEECIQLIYEMIGYCLHNTAELHKAFILLGEGANGKSTLLMALERLLGKENVSNIPLQKLEEDRFAVASLFGKLANLYADIPETPLKKCDAFNTIVAGDRVYAEFKYRDAFSFQPSATQIFSCNKIPASYTHSEGYFRRLLVIPFPNRFDGKERRNQTDILDEIASPPELEGVLITALHAFVNVRDSGAFTVPEVSRQALADYKETNEPALRFLSDYVVESNDAYTTRSELFGAYKRWIQDAEPTRKPLSDRKFYGFVRATFPQANDKRERINGQQVRVFEGLQLADDLSDALPQPEQTPFM